MAVRKRKPRTKRLYSIEGHVFSSKILFELYEACVNARKDGLITSFDIREESLLKSKYSAFKPTINEITFDSALEADFYIRLLYEKKNGRIQSFERQVVYELQPRFRKNGVTFRPITYISDFDVIDKGGNKIVFDTKGKETVDFKIKHKLFEYKFPDLSLKVITKYKPSGEWLELKDIRKLEREAKKKKEKYKK